jgi:hypothetical protein
MARLIRTLATDSDGDVTATIEIGGVGSDSRKQAVDRYFMETPSPREEIIAERLLWVAAVFGALAIVMLVLGMPILAACAGVISGIMLLQGIEQRLSYQRRFAKAEPKPSDEQMDDLLRADIRRAADRALQRLGLTRDELELRSYDVDPLAERGGKRLADQGRGPITVFGPANETRAMNGRDRKWRFSRYEIMVICPTGHHLGIYGCVLELATGRRRNEETREYHYEDVVAVGTITRASGDIDILVRGEKHGFAILGRTLVRTFEVVVSSGDRSSIVVGIKDDDADDREYVELQESGIDRVIEAVRRMLREKKGGIAPSV